MPVMKTLTINGRTFTVTPVVPTDSVTLLASAWEAGDGKYHQVVELSGVTPQTKVDLQPTSKQLVEFHDKVLGFVAENDGGVVTVFAIGDQPTNDHTIQITMTEVDATGKIRGNTVGTTMPRSDWAQTDPTKADYIKNKPTNLNGTGGNQETDPTVPAWAKQSNKPTYTAQEVGADPAGTAAIAVVNHNVDAVAHKDIRDDISRITALLNDIADSDDQTLNEFSEIVAYIKSNKSLIDAITTSKVSVTDIVDNMETDVANKPLSARIGFVLKNLIDLLEQRVSKSIGDLNSGKLDASALPDAIEEALTQAKASGEFDGAQGPAYTLTDVDRATITAAVIEGLPKYAGEVEIA